MYDNIGDKIKGLAKALCIIETITAAIAGIVFLVDGSEDKALLGFLLTFGGFVISWLSSWPLYGFGELINKACDIARNTYTDGGNSEAQTKVDFERVKEIEKLRSQGLITEEEYQQAISNGDKR